MAIFTDAIDRSLTDVDFLFEAQSSCHLQDAIKSLSAQAGAEPDNYSAALLRWPFTATSSLKEMDNITGKLGPLAYIAKTKRNIKPQR